MKKKKIPTNTDYFTYYNANPKQLICCDCVVRAISLATAKSWTTVVRELTEVGIENAMTISDPKLFPIYLKRLGFTQGKEPRDCCNRKMTVKEWMQREQIYPGNQKDIILVNAGSHHLACIIDGTVHDIWDSSRVTMHKYWYKSW